MDFFSRKQILNVRNWDEQVTSFCTQNELSIRLCAFHIAGIKTFYIRNDAEVGRDFFANAYHQSIDLLYQTYTIDVIPKQYDFSNVRIIVDDEFLEATIVFEPEFFVDTEDMYKSHLLHFVLYSLIQKKIMLTSVEFIRTRLEKILSQFNAPHVLSDEKRYLLLKSKAHYREAGFTNILEEKWCKENNHSPFNNAMYAAKEGDQIGVFLKEPLCINGRNLKGEYVDMGMLYSNKIATTQTDDKKDTNNAHAQESKKTQTKSFSPPEINGDGIKKVEEDNVIKYEANANGFISFKDSKIELIDIATLNQVGVNTTGCMLGGVDKYAEVDIECYDNSKDALQSNTTLEAEIVNIKGNVGENTVIRAKRLHIKGQTHQSAVIYAQEAFISIHKGTLYCKEADVEMLEAGRVNAEYANILDLQGGKVVANKVVISRLHSHSNVDFCEKLHLKIIENGDNKLNFDIFADSEKKGKMLALVKKDELLKTHVKSRVEYCKSLAEKLYKIKPVVENLKPILRQSKKEGFPLDKDIKKTFAYYVGLLKQIKLHKENVLKLQQSRVQNAKEARELDNLLKFAKITTEASWRDNNQIVLTKHFPYNITSIFMQDSDMYDVVVNDDGALESINQE